MMSATRAREMMIEHRKARVEAKIYDAIKQGFIGVVVEVELISDEVRAELRSLGYDLTPIQATKTHAEGVSIKWSEKV